MPAVESVLAGGHFSRVAILDNLNGATYTGSATLVASLWPGDGQPAEFAPTVAWEVLADLSVRIVATAAQTATLAPGDYPVMVSVTEGGATQREIACTMRVLAAPGTDDPPTVYCTLNDMTTVAPWVENLRSPTDQAGFAEQRAQARVECDRMIQRHYRGQRGRRQTTLDYLMDGNGVGCWRDGSDDAALQAWLDDDRLILTGPSGLALVRWNALTAVAIVCEGQIDDDDKYMMLAQKMRMRARELAANIVAQVDTTDTADGVGDITIDLGVADTLRS